MIPLRCGRDLSQEGVRTTEFGEGVVVFKLQPENPYVVSVLSDICLRRDVLPSARGGRPWAKYDVDQS